MELFLNSHTMHPRLKMKTFSIGIYKWFSLAKELAYGRKLSLKIMCRDMYTLLVEGCQHLYPLSNELYLIKMHGYVLGENLYFPWSLRYGKHWQPNILKLLYSRYLWKNIKK